MNMIAKIKTNIAPPAIVALGVLVSLNSAGCGDCDIQPSSGYTPPDYTPPDDDYDPNDTDFDRLVGDADNCPTVYNEDQTDTDGDGLGDVCDNCTAVANVEQADTDFDRFGDACDNCPEDGLKTEPGVCGCGSPDVDFDGDGEIDCEGPGGGEERLIDGAGLGGEQVQVIDLDGDGDLDIVASFRESRAIYGYLNDGTGASFQKINVAAATTIVPGDFVIADIDADGDLDVAAIELYDDFLGDPSPGQVVLYKQPPNPATTWERVDVTDQEMWGVRGIDAGDLNNDEQLDIVVGATEVIDGGGARHGNGVYCMENLAAGFTWSDPVAIDEELTLVLTVGVLDITGDGRMDVIACESEGIDLAWYENTGTGEGISFEKDSVGIYHARDMLIVEDGFGYADDHAVIMADELEGSLDLVYVIPGTDPQEIWGRDVITSEYPDGMRSGMCVLDFNGDGMRDIAASSVEHGTVRVYLSAPGERDSIEWNPASVITGYGGLVGVGCGDLDGDLRPDLVTLTDTGGGADRLAWWPNTP